MKDKNHNMLFIIALSVTLIVLAVLFFLGRHLDAVRDANLAKYENVSGVFDTDSVKGRLAYSLTDGTMLVEKCLLSYRVEDICSRAFEYRTQISKTRVKYPELASQGYLCVSDLVCGPGPDSMRFTWSLFRELRPREFIYRKDLPSYSFASGLEMEGFNPLFAKCGDETFLYELIKPEGEERTFEQYLTDFINENIACYLQIIEIIPHDRSIHEDKMKIMLQHYRERILELDPDYEFGNVI